MLKKYKSQNDHVEWDTHVIVHSNQKVVGITTRKGEALKQLQDAIS